MHYIYNNICKYHVIPATNTTGYSGDLCQYNMDTCSSNPCQHDQGCSNFRSSYRCDCSTHFTGTHCEKLTEVCFNNNC